MSATPWNVLLVDDEPDMLAVTTLALKNIKIFGLPVKIHTCKSKAEAIAFLQKDSRLLPETICCFIDVVMDNDHAGLELCQYIRQELRNKTTQLIVLTGQPGVAPERTVIDAYDINGYLAKVEATENKLYTTLKAAARAYQLNAITTGVLTGMNLLLDAPHTKAAIRENLQRWREAWRRNANGEVIESRQHKLTTMVGNEIVNSTVSENETVAYRDSLHNVPGIRLSNGATFVIRGHDLQVRCQSPMGTECVFTREIDFEWPENAVRIMATLVKLVGTLWETAS